MRLIFILLALACATISAARAANVEFPRGASAYVVAAPDTALAKRTLARLIDYLGKVLKRGAIVTATLEAVPNGAPAIILASRELEYPIPIKAPTDNPESFALRTAEAGGRRVVVAVGNTDRGLKRAVQTLIIKSRQEKTALVIPSMDLAESPWIAHREWTICPWQPQFVRGCFYDTKADQRMNIWRYDDHRLAKYVEMFDWFGFSGCQLIEACYTYNLEGSIEATQDWQKRTAGFVRDNGQEVSLWAWTAQFDGFGWRDADVTYTPAAGKTAYQDVNVRRGFEKYYDRYADLAPYADRFIAHFFDPGQLHDHSQVFKYMRLLERKLKAKNPSIQMGIDCWAASPTYLTELAENGFKDYLILPTNSPLAFSTISREEAHETAKKLGLRLGIWGWYITEYETDQLASMYVNAKLLKNLYTEMRNGALKIQPVEYWSEMEAHHLNDIYSMYVSGRLLWNPDADPHEMLAELTDGIWGPNSPKVLRALELIEDVRTGSTWETYWWTDPACICGTASPANDLRRAKESLAELKSMKADSSFVPKFPLPYPPETFVELMLPHLEQIRLYAEFRLKVDALQQAAAAGASKQDMEKALADAWQPIPEFNTWLGTFGCKEIRAQKATVAELRAKYNLSAPDPEWFRELEANRCLDLIRTRQQATNKPFVITTGAVNGEFYWSDENALDRLHKLEKDGKIIAEGEGKFKLVDWEKWVAK